MTRRSPTSTPLETATIAGPSGILQRQCKTCSQRTIAGAECEDCQKRKGRLQRYCSRSGELSAVPTIAVEALRSPSQPLDSANRRLLASTFQPEFSQVQLSGVATAGLQGLQLGTAGDRHEQEADRMADWVMRSAAQPEQRLSQTAASSAGISALSQVQIHTGPQAAAAAEAVNAWAYTVGHHIVFGQGQYAPGTPTGRRLLAHEAAHVVQQAGGAIAMPPQRSPALSVDRPAILRRTPDPFTVSGLYPNRADEPNVVFFDIAEPGVDDLPPDMALDPAERAKIEAIAQAMQAATPPITTITIYGYASEEGGSAVNTPLIARRLQAVSNVLQGAGISAADITLVSSFSRSRRQVDYRFWRCVELQPGNAASQRVGATGTSRVPCDPDQTSAVNDAKTTAQDLIADTDGALPQLNRYIANPADEPGVGALLDSRFSDHSDTTARAVRDRIQAIHTTLGQIGGSISLVCGTEDEPSCRAGGGATANPTQVMVCPTFFGGYAAIQDEILLHESAHASGFRARDRAYRRERVIFFLNTQQALDNAESLSLFVIQMNGETPSIGPEQPDVATGCGANEQVAQEAIAWAQRWNTYAVFGTAQTYGDASREAYMAPYIARWFGRSDRTALAGIYDRYRQMDEVFDRQLQVRCLLPADPACSTTTPIDWTLPDAIAICPAFFTISDRDRRIRAIYAALAIDMPGVTPTQAQGYPRLAKDYMVHYWEVT